MKHLIVLAVLALTNLAGAENYTEYHKPEPCLCQETHHPEEGETQEVEWRVTWGKVNCTPAVIPPNNTQHCQQGAATTCGCHSGIIVCDGVMTNGVKQRPYGKHCIQILNQNCWGERAVKHCHHHFHDELEILYDLEVIVAIITVLSLLVLLCSVAKGKFKFRARGWCRFNPLVILVVMLANKARGEVMGIGSCNKDGVCLKEIDIEGHCSVDGWSWPEMQIQWGSEAFCWQHDCCSEARTLYDVSKCKNGEYTWATGCGLRHHGCHACGARILGNRQPIYVMTAERAVCTLRVGSKTFPGVCSVTKEVLYLSPSEQCISNPPQKDKQGTFKYQGDFDCNCPNPWHCQAVGNLKFDGICLKQAPVKVHGNRCKVGIPGPIEVQSIECPQMMTNETVPCSRNGSICWTKDCNMTFSHNDIRSTKEMVAGWVQDYVGVGVPSWWELFLLFFKPTTIVIGILIILVIFLLLKR